MSGIVDRVLAREGRSRRVAVPHVPAALATVRRTEPIAAVPRRSALSHAQSYGLGTVAPPIRRFNVRLIWSRCSASDPVQAWLRDAVMQAARRIPARWLTKPGRGRTPPDRHCRR